MSKSHYIIPIFVPHRGCPHSCIFCNQRKITGSEGDIKGKDVLSTAEAYLNTIPKGKYVELSFFGGSFTAIPIEYQNELLKSAKTLLNEGRINAIRLSTRPDYIDDAILKNLKDYGVSIIELGVQSMDEDVLLKSERGHTSKDVVKASSLIKKYGFKLGLQMMIGLPGDNEEIDKYTAKRIIELKPDFVRIYPALIIKNTKMEEMYFNGEYKPYSLEETIDIVSKLYLLFTEENIDIIRIGLQTTDNINVGKDIVAGPFHPSIREHVESTIINKMADRIIGEDFKDSNNIIISIKFISKLFANKKVYFNNLKSMYPLKNIRGIEDLELSDMEIVVSDSKKRRKMSIYNYIKLVK